MSYWPDQFVKNHLKAWNKRADKTCCGNCGESDWLYNLTPPLSIYRCNKCKRTYAIHLIDGTIYEEKGDPNARR
jgi:hypothetical protein